MGRNWKWGSMGVGNSISGTYGSYLRNFGIAFRLCGGGWGGGCVWFRGGSGVCSVFVVVVVV